MKKLKLTNMKKEKIKISTKKAASILASNGIVLHPTDTVFGISGLYSSKIAYDLIYSTKKRPIKKPLGLLISCIDDIKKFSLISLSCIKPIFPLLEQGMTILLPVKDSLPKHLTSQSDFVGIRIPNHKQTKDLIKLAGPLISTSANLSGNAAITSYREDCSSLGEGIYCLQGEEPKYKINSTILKYQDGQYTVVREGNISIAEVTKYITL